MVWYFCLHNNHAISDGFIWFSFSLIPTLRYAHSNIPIRITLWIVAISKHHNRINARSLYLFGKRNCFNYEAALVACPSPVLCFISFFSYKSLFQSPFPTSKGQATLSNAVDGLPALGPALCTSHSSRMTDANHVGGEWVCSQLKALLRHTSWQSISTNKFPSSLSITFPTVRLPILLLVFPFSLSLIFTINFSGFFRKHFSFFFSNLEEMSGLT